MIKYMLLFVAGLVAVIIVCTFGKHQVSSPHREYTEHWKAPAMHTSQFFDIEIIAISINLQHYTAELIGYPLTKGSVKELISFIRKSLHPT